MRCFNEVFSCPKMFHIFKAIQFLLDNEFDRFGGYFNNYQFVSFNALTRYLDE